MVYHAKLRRGVFIYLFINIYSHTQKTFQCVFFLKKIKNYKIDLIVKKKIVVSSNFFH